MRCASGLFCFLLLLFNTFPLYASDHDISTAAAVKLITSTQPITGFKGFAGALSGLTPSLQKAQLLYSSQLNAIAIIGRSKIKGQVLYLIPYLDYVSNASYCVSGPQFMGDISETRDAWPTFSAILDAPDASSALQHYCLNKHNPAKLRLSSFLVLRYVDKDAFKQISHTLNADFDGSPSNTKVYIKHIEDGTYMFWGVRDLDEPYHE
jgi:hypothetical protein